MKYTYEKIIQQNYSAYGWEDASVYNCNSQGKIKDPVLKKVFIEDLKNYLQLGYSTRTILRKTKNI